MNMPEAIPDRIPMQANVIDYFLHNRQRHPHRIAVHCGESTLTYTELAGRVACLSGMLRDMGVRQGDVILLLLENSVDFSAVMLAAADIGAVLAPLATSSSPAGMDKAIEVTGASFILGTRPPLFNWINTREGDRPIGPANILVFGRPIESCRHRDELAGINPAAHPLGRSAVSPEAPFILTLTSGSTGAPKPIVLSQATKLARSFDGARDLYGLGDDEVIITSSPMYHSLGMRMALLPLLIGGESVILERYSADNWLDAVERHRVTFAIMVSNQLEQLVHKLKERSPDIGALGCIVSSSALLKPEVKQACIQGFACDFHECYGASEVGIVTNLAPEDCRDNLRSVGKALPYVDLHVCDEQGKPLKAGEQGEICCTTTTGFTGYLNNPDATAHAMTGGFFHTGDIGYLDEEGYLYLCGRQKDIIIVGGTNVFPEDIEAVLQDQPGVRECAVVGVDDAHFGEAILAAIVADPDGPPDLRAICLQLARQLADYQQPMAYELVDRLPRSPLNKIMRHKLRERFEGYDVTAALRGLFG